jgi:hypothetical protein
MKYNKYVVLLLALINVPNFPNLLSVGAFGFSIGIFVAMFINDHFNR